MVDILVKGKNDLRDLRQTAALPGTLMDWVLTPEGLSEDEELASAVRVALGTDALANPEEILPDPDSTDRRGWWGDLDAEVIWDGWPIGTKNWLLLRSKITEFGSAEGATVVRAERYTYEALRPFIDKGIASRIDVEGVRVGRQEIDVHVKMYRGPLRAIQLTFAYLWDQTITR